MDIVHIDGLRVRGTHGHYAKERHADQEFEVSVQATTDTRRAGKSDALRDAVDYAVLKKIVEDVFRGSSHYLLESLAEEVARKALVDRRIISLTVTIKKLSIWESGVPGVTITRPC